MVAVPRRAESVEHTLSHRTDLRHAARLARTTSAAPPDTSAGLLRLIDAYSDSRLAQFHRAFDRDVSTIDGIDGTVGIPVLAGVTLPSCVTRPIAAPNDLLLQPSVIQHVTRVLMSHGFSARDVATLIQARYEADHGWGTRWSWMDPESRSSFDVRVFGGMLMAGVDEAVDLNCCSAQEKGLCPGGECGLDLRTARARLLTAVRS